MVRYIILATFVAFVSAGVYPGGSSRHSIYHDSYGSSHPVVKFVPSTNTVQHNYIKPDVVTTAQYTGPSSFRAAQQTVNYDTVSPGKRNSYFGNSYNSGSLGSRFGAIQQDSTSYSRNVAHTTIVKQTAPLVSKSSYVFSAPEDHEDIQHDQTIVLPRPKQHYKVVFVNAPATTVVNTPSAAVGGQAQEKTLIYVVSDKKRVENHIEVPEVDQAKLQKPEVFFIKNNKPTEHVNSKIKYETVNLVPGAENGAVNNVPNKVSNNYQDETPSAPAQNGFGQQIANAISAQSLQGVNNFGSLVQAGTGLFGSFIPG